MRADAVPPAPGGRGAANEGREGRPTFLVVGVLLALTPLLRGAEPLCLPGKAISKLGGEPPFIYIFIFTP